MTANWDQLNKEFDNLFDNLTDEDWNNWIAQKEAKKAIRREILTMKATIQSIILELQNKLKDYSCSFDFETKISEISNSSCAILDFDTKRRIAKISLDDYTPPIAA